MVKVRVGRLAGGIRKTRTVETGWNPLTAERLSFEHERRQNPVSGVIELRVWSRACSWDEDASPQASRGLGEPPEINARSVTPTLHTDEALW